MKLYLKGNMIHIQECIMELQELFINMEEAFKKDNGKMDKIMDGVFNMIKGMTMDM